MTESMFVTKPIKGGQFRVGQTFDITEAEEITPEDPRYVELKAKYDEVMLRLKGGD